MGSKKDAVLCTASKEILPVDQPFCATMWISAAPLYMGTR